MSGTAWAAMVPGIVALLTGVGAWLKAQAARQSAQSAHTRIDALAPGSNVNVAPGVEPK